VAAVQVPHHDYRTRSHQQELSEDRHQGEQGHGDYASAGQDRREQEHQQRTDASPRPPPAVIVVVSRSAHGASLHAISLIPLQPLAWESPRAWDITDRPGGRYHLR
jgi:hypothetical protein